MSTHDAEYFRQSHRAQGIAVREPFFESEFPREATDPRRLDQLSWPRNLFGELATIAELMAESDDTVPSTAGTRVPAGAIAS